MGLYSPPTASSQLNFRPLPAVVAGFFDRRKPVVRCGDFGILVSGRVPLAPANSVAFVERHIMCMEPSAGRAVLHSHGHHLRIQHTPNFLEFKFFEWAVLAHSDFL